MKKLMIFSLLCSASFAQAILFNAQELRDLYTFGMAAQKNILALAQLDEKELNAQEKEIQDFFAQVLTITAIESCNNKAAPKDFKTMGAVIEVFNMLSTIYQRTAAEIELYESELQNKVLSVASKQKIGNHINLLKSQIALIKDKSTIMKVAVLGSEFKGKLEASGIKEVKDRIIAQSGNDEFKQKSIVEQNFIVMMMTDQGSNQQ